MVYAMVAVAQAAIITSVFCLWPHRAPQRSILISPYIDLLLGLAALGVSAMTLGLLVSTACANPQQAVSVNLQQAINAVTGVTIVQIALNGITVGLPHLSTTGTVAALLPDRWGAAAAASSIGLRDFEGTQVGPDPLWSHSVAWWITDVGALVVLSALYFTLAVLVLDRRLRPPRPSRKRVAAARAGRVALAAKAPQPQP